MRKALWLLALPPVGLALCACAAASNPERSGADGSAPAPAGATIAEAGEAGEAEESIALGSVPVGVRVAAEGAVSGISFTCAEREVENGSTVYTLCGTANGKKYEIEVTADGKVVEVENGDCHDGDDDGEEDDD